MIMPRRSPSLPHSAGVPGSLPLPSSRQAGHREAPSPLPHSHCFQRDLGPSAFLSSFAVRAALPWALTPCWWAAVLLSPSLGALWETAASMRKQKEEQVVPGLPHLAQCQAPRCRLLGGATPSFAAQDPPWLPPAPELCSAWGVFPHFPRHQQRDGGQAVPCGGVRLPPAHITSSGGDGGGRAPLPLCPPP